MIKASDNNFDIWSDTHVEKYWLQDFWEFRVPEESETMFRVHFRTIADPSSIYSWSIGHILEHEFFCLGRLGSSGSKGKKVDLSYSE